MTNMSYAEKRTDQAFTLIELLVVMVIIGVLAGLLLPNYMSARKRARDTQRKNDLTQLQNSLEIYKMDQSPAAYPATLDLESNCDNCWSSAGMTASCDSDETIYAKEVPCDPSSSEDYQYSYTRDSSLEYTLSACLENASDPQGDDVDTDTCPSGKQFTKNEP